MADETAVVKAGQTAITAKDMESLLMGGDIGKLSPEGRLAYYKRRCEDLGLDPLARPFDYLFLNGKTVLYANKGCFEQLRANRHISINIVSQSQIGDLFIVTARATLPDGRYDEDTGAVDMAGKKGENAANAILKAITKSKRRVTLSICSLGMLDETEVDSIAGATKITVSESGELIGDQQTYGKGAKVHTYRTAWNDKPVPVDGHNFKNFSHLYCDTCRIEWDKLSDAERNKEMGIEVPPSNPSASPGAGEGGTGAGASGDAAPSKEFPVPPGAPFRPAPPAGDSGAAIGSSPLAALPDESPAKKQFMARMQALAIKNSYIYHKALLEIGLSEGYAHAAEVPGNRLEAVEVLVRKAVEEAGPAKRHGRPQKQAEIGTGTSQAPEAPASVSSIPVDCQALWAEVYKALGFQGGEDMRAFLSENLDVNPDTLSKVKPSELKAFLELALALKRDVNEATKLKRAPGNGSFTELLAYLQKSFPKESWLRALTVGDIPATKVWEAIRRALEPPAAQPFTKEDYELQFGSGDII